MSVVAYTCEKLSLGPDLPSLWSRRSPATLHAYFIGSPLVQSLIPCLAGNAARCYSIQCCDTAEERMGYEAGDCVGDDVNLWNWVADLPLQREDGSLISASLG